MSPHVLMKGSKPDLSDHHAFGSECWMYHREGLWSDSKFDPHGDQCLNLSNPPDVLAIENLNEQYIASVAGTYNGKLVIEVHSINAPSEAKLFSLCPSRYVDLLAKVHMQCLPESHLSLVESGDLLLGAHDSEESDQDIALQANLVDVPRKILEVMLYLLGALQSSLRYRVSLTKSALR